MTKVTSGFCRHQNCVPWGCLPLTCGYIHLLKHEKMCVKSEIEEILFKIATNDHSDEAFLLHKKFGPNGLSAPAQGLCLNFFSSITTDFNISSALRWAIQDQWSSVFFCFVLFCFFFILQKNHFTYQFISLCHFNFYMHSDNANNPNLTSMYYPLWESLIKFNGIYVQFVVLAITSCPI